MTLCKGDIWLVNLNPVKKNNEMGKIRPAVIFQNNELIQNNYPTTIIIPLSTFLIDDAEPIRMRITKRDSLEKDSDIVLTQIRAIDNSRFVKKIASLTNNEMQKLKQLFDEIVG
ncbi:MAG: type II toxin-antitoxin system PemK/MazF family toxin [Epsilonproteobacteria bacterium]|nr:type II toxin-antitoxin system PemK/MazF family toxin [Campylobacterota bacterium]